MINDPLPDALDGIDDAVEDSRHHIATGVLYGFAKIVLDALERVAQQPAQERGDAADRRADALEELVGHAAPVDSADSRRQVLAQLLPVDRLNGFRDKIQRAFEKIADCLTDPGPVDVLDEFVDALPQRRAGLAELEILNRGLYDRQRRVKVFSQRRADFFPVNAREQVRNPRAEASTHSRPVNTVHGLADFRHQ